MCFHPRLQPLVHNRGSLSGNNRVQWIRLKGFKGGHFGILNVYAFNMVGEDVPCGMKSFNPSLHIVDEL